VYVFITAVPSTKLFAWGEEWAAEDMCYERRRAKACAESAHQVTKSFFRCLCVTVLLTEGAITKAVRGYFFLKKNLHRHCHAHAQSGEGAGIALILGDQAERCR